MATPRLSRVQQLFLSASMVATLGFGTSNAMSLMTGTPKRLRYGAIIDRSSWSLSPDETSSARAVQNGCERRRKSALRRNERELANCTAAPKIVSSLIVFQIVGLGTSGMLLGTGLALSMGERGARRRMWIGGVLGFCVMGGGVLAMQSFAHTVYAQSDAEYCLMRARSLEDDIAVEYTNCIAHGQEAIRTTSPSR